MTAPDLPAHLPLIVDEPNRSTVMRGVPVPADKIVTGDERWLLDPDQGSWAMQNVPAFLHVDTVSRGDGPIAPLTYGDSGLMRRRVDVAGLGDTTLVEASAQLDIDAFVLLKDGELRAELYRNGMRPGSRHSLNSVTKSFVATVIGSLVDEGLLDLHAPFADSFPELAHSGVADATLQDALDMAIGVEWPMDWDNPRSHRYLNFMAGGFQQRFDRFPYANTLDLIAQTKKVRPHGERYVYTAVCTELLGWSMSRALGHTWQQALAARVWHPMGAESDGLIVVDPGGHGFATCGLVSTLRDMARFGLVLQNGGVCGTRRIVSERWVDEIHTPNDRLTAAMAGSPEFALFPDLKFYHNQFRVLDPAAGEFLALGGLGQMIFVNRAKRIVCAVQSTGYAPDQPGVVARLYAALRDALTA